MRACLLVLVLLCQSVAWARPIMVGVTSWIGSAPANVADAQGFWKEQGLDVHLVKYAEYKDLFRDFKDRKLDLVYDMTGTWVDLHQQGYPLTIVAETDWSNGGDKLIAKNALADLTKLKGQPVGVYLNRTSVTFLLDRFLKAQKLKLSDVKLVEMEGEPLAQAFVQNKFQLILDYDPPAIDARRKGDGRIVADSAAYPGVMPEGFAIHNDSKAELGHDTLVKFFAGWVKALKWINGSASWPAFQKVLNERTFAGEQPYSAFDLLGMLNSVRFHTTNELVRRNQPGGGMTAYLTEVHGFLKENGKLKRDFSPEELVDASALIDAVQKSAQ